MNDYLTQFEKYLYNVKKSSENTVEAYIRDINQFIAYCNMNGTSDLLKVDESFLRKYLEYLDFLDKSAATKSRIIASVRCFYKYLISIGAIKSNPCDSIRFKKNAPKMPGILDSNEVVLLLSQPSGKDFKSVRDRAMLELLYATGIKVSELISLQVSQINLQLGLLHLTGEKNERIIPIYPVAVKHLNEYINSVRPALIIDNNLEILFVNMNGNPMSRQGFWKIIKHYSILAGISKDITPQTLRHSFAAHLLENGAHLKDIKEMLGHSDISSTQIYAQYIKSKYAQNYIKFHPLAK